MKSSHLNKFFSVLFAVLVSALHGLAQESLVLLDEFVVEGRIIESDNIGNLYLIDNGKVGKYTNTGKLLVENSSLAMGDIFSLDATNALKMPVFFLDLSQVVYVDNNLAPRGDPIQLDVSGYPQTSCVCSSYNDGLWLFDKVSFELVRLNEFFEETNRSGNLIQILGFAPDPVYMRELSNWLYVADPNRGILVFDWYGAYTKTIPVKGVRKFVIRAGRIYYITSDKLEYFDLKTGKFAATTLPVSHPDDFTITGNRLYILTNGKVSVFRLNTP